MKIPLCQIPANGNFCLIGQAKLLSSVRHVAGGLLANESNQQVSIRLSQLHEGTVVRLRLIKNSQLLGFSCLVQRDTRTPDAYTPELSRHARQCLFLGHDRDIGIRKLVFDVERSLEAIIGGGMKVIGSARRGNGDQAYRQSQWACTVWSSTSGSLWAVKVAPSAT